MGFQEWFYAVMVWFYLSSFKRMQGCMPTCTGVVTSQNANPNCSGHLLILNDNTWTSVY